MDTLTELRLAAEKHRLAIINLRIKAGNSEDADFRRAAEAVAVEYEDGAVDVARLLVEVAHS